MDRFATQKALSQYFTPRWAAEAIVDHYFSDLTPGSRVIEPSCGDGSFLMALPDHLDVLGIEIDPVHAQRARQASSRQVICADFLELDAMALPQEIDAVIGNPPFVAETVAGFLDRSHALLKEGGRCGFILPAYVLQTSSKVMQFAQQWSIQTELMPRNLFPGLSLPLTFTLFTKERVRRLHGFFLYRETAEMTDIQPRVRELLNASKKSGSVWRQAVQEAFRGLGKTRASLAEIYGAIERRPTANPNWAQQVRKVLQSYPEFQSLERGVWALNCEAVPA